MKLEKEKGYRGHFQKIYKISFDVQNYVICYAFTCVIYLYMNLENLFILGHIFTFFTVFWISVGGLGTVFCG